MTLSTAESELCAGCEGVTLAQSLEALTTELDGTRGLKNLMVDNTAAVTLAEGGGSVRTRHLRVRAAFMHDMKDRQELAVSHCPGDIQLADCLTKALVKTRLEELSRLLGLGPPGSIGKVAKVSVTFQEGQGISQHPLSRTAHTAQVDDSGANSGLGPYPGADSGLGPNPGANSGLGPDPGADSGLGPNPGANSGLGPNPGANSGLGPSPGADSGLGPNPVPQYGIGLWLMILALMLQVEQSEATPNEGEQLEPVGLELSLIIVLMTMSILFLWESGKSCVRMCCSHRSEDEPQVRTIRTDDQDEARDRRSRRQEAVRRAIAREITEGERHHCSVGGPEATESPSRPQVHSYVHVQVGSEGVTQAESQVPTPNPPCPRGQPSNFHQPNLRSTGLSEQASSSSEAIPPPPPPYPPSNLRPDFPMNDGGSKLDPEPKVLTDASTQTDQQSGLSFTELCELHVITTTSKTAGAVHFFPTCHALRNTVSTQDRMFCRYCLQAVKEGRLQR